MLDSVTTLKQFIVSAQNELQTDGASHQELAESLIQELIIYFPDSYKTLEERGVLLLLNKPEELRASLADYFSYESDRLNSAPGQLEQTTATMTPGEIAERARLYQQASAHAQKKIDGFSKQKKESLADYARRLGEALPEQMKAALKREGEAAALEKISAEIREKASSVQSKKDLDKYKDYLLEAYKNHATELEKHLAAAEIATQKEYELFLQKESVLQGADEVLLLAKQRTLNTDSITNPEVFFSKSIDYATDLNTTPENAVLVAEVAAWAQSDIDTSRISLGGHGFFQTIAGQSAASVRADAVFDRLAPHEKSIILKEVIDASLLKSETEIQDKPHLSAADHDLLNMHRIVRETVRTHDAQISQASKPASRVEKLMETTFSDMRISPDVVRRISTATSGSIDWLSSQGIYAFLLRDKFETVLGSAGKFVVKEGVEKAAATAVTKGLGGKIGAWLGTFLPLPPGISNAIGYVGGELILGNLMNFGGKVVGGFVNFFRTAGGALSIIEGKEPTLLAAGIMAALLLVFILPTPLNFPNTIEGVRRTALVEGLGGGPPDGTPDQGGIVVDCSLPENKATNPQCNFSACVPSEADPSACQWPTTGAITQGPHTENTCGGNIPGSSHDAGTAANGIDFGGGIGSSGNTPVFTPKSGTVTEYVNNCGLNTGIIGNTCGGGYGNYVKFLSDDGYLMIFGHLAPNLPESVLNKTHMEAHEQIGKMDQTGNSTGSHLHFGVLSGQSVLDLIPSNDPAALPDQINGCLAECGKPCPSGWVSP